VGIVVPAWESGPAALGYLCVAGLDSRDAVWWGSAIAGFCVARGLALRNIYADTLTLGRCRPGEGWRSLLAEVAGLPGVIVAVPWLEHLGEDAQQQAQRSLQVTGAGGLVQPVITAGVSTRPGPGVSPR
jgi:hypothetical protein